MVLENKTSQFIEKQLKKITSTTPQTAHSCQKHGISLEKFHTIVNINKTHTTCKKLLTKVYPISEIENGIECKNLH
jgi:hypothetical protein